MFRARVLLVDINGTIVQGGDAVDGAADAICALRRSGYVLRFLTQTESKTAEQTARRLAGYGLEIAPDEVFTPVLAARMLLERSAGARVLALMSDAVKQTFGSMLARKGHTHVVVGDCQEVLDYRLLDDAFRAVRAGAELIALQPGRYFRSDDGEHIDTGAIVAALEHATGASARLVGKPSGEFFTFAALSAGVTPEETAVVGDDATTDIGGGNSVGATTIQVRTGKYAERQGSAYAVRAMHAIDSIATLPELLADLASKRAVLPRT